jgi:hypothetical protein
VVAVKQISKIILNADYRIFIIDDKKAMHKLTLVKHFLG